MATIALRIANTQRVGCLRGETMSELCDWQAKGGLERAARNPLAESYRP
jgi:hypothetical protein